MPILSSRNVDLCLEKVRKVAHHHREDLAFVGLLKSCAKARDLCRGNRLHDTILNKGLLQNSPYVGSALISMYAKCGALKKAHRLLEELPFRDVVTWSALISAYAQQGYGDYALDCFERMQIEGLSPDCITFTCVLKACSGSGVIEKGKQVHNEVIIKGLEKEYVSLGNGLLDMYAKCGALTEAKQVLDKLRNRDIVSWNALISGYVQQGRGKDAMACFEDMQRDGLSPDPITFTCILKACGSIGAIDKGKQIHEEIVRKGLLGNDTMVGNALVDMYARFGTLPKAKEVLDELLVRDIVSWSMLIDGYTQHGHGEEALKCYEEMQKEGLSPNVVTFTCLLKASGSTGAIDKGKAIHEEIVSKGLLDKDIVLGNALADMYAKCGELSNAEQVLSELPVRDTASWNVLISGYAYQGRGDESLNCLQRMQREGLPPNSITFICILKVCGLIGAIGKGQTIHEEIIGKGFLGTDIMLDTALVDMYARCGSLTKAQEVLNDLSLQNVVSWNALISGFAQQGQSEEALNGFERMQCEGIVPNTVTFLCVLNACSHAGLVNEAQMYFTIMSEKYGIVPNSKHQTCMVDLFCRAGLFDKAMAVIKKMPSCDYPVVWGALIDACKKLGNANLAKFAFEQVVQLDCIR